MRVRPQARSGPAWRAPGAAAALAALLATGAGAAAGADDRIGEVLALCDSPDPAARRFCVAELRRQGDPERRAFERLRRMAADDPVLAADAVAALEALYGAGAAAAAETAAAPAEPTTAPAAPAPPQPARAPAAAAVTSRQAPAGVPARRWPRDPGATRVLFFPTAFTRPAGEVAWTIFDLGHWTFDYGVHDSLELGVQTGPPVGALMIAPQIKLALHAPGASAGVFVMGGVLIAVVGDEGDDDTLTFYGGGPAVTLGDGDRMFNVGFQAYGLSIQGEDLALLLPNAGASIRLSRRLRAGVELTVPSLAEGDELDTGDIVIVLYGLRVIGERIWGDVAFAYPACDGCDEITDVLPFGLPLLGVGFAW